MLVSVDNNLYTLTEGQTLQIQAGQTLRVFYSFNYRVAEPVAVPIWGSLYQKTLGLVNRVGQAQTKTNIALEPSVTGQGYQGQMNITVGSGVGAGGYGLIVEMPGFSEANARIDDCIEVTAAPGLTDWLGPLLMIGVMGMIARMAVPAAGADHG
jgi:hypothetical protein